MPGLDTLVQSAVKPALTEMEADRILERIWDHDHAVWKQDPGEIANRLGWLHVHETMPEHLPSLEAFVHQVRDAGYTRALLLGMGGSSLAPEVFSKTFGAKPGHLELSILDSTDPGAILEQTAGLDPARTLFIVSTKSGGTVETLSFFKYMYNRVADACGREKTGQHFIAITDPGSSLARLAAELTFRATFLNDPNIGGRFSALSLFGLVPASLLGVEAKKLLHGALAMAARCRQYGCQLDQPISGACLGAILGELAKNGYDKATFIISQDLTGFGDWLEQLIAESTGKEGAGILPVVHEQPGPPEVYGQDRLFIHIRFKGDGQHDRAIAVLKAAGRPVLRLDLDDAYELGGQMFLWEFATAVAGARLGINPFDQPDVESAKVQARAMVQAYRDTGTLPRGGSSPPDHEVLKKFLSGSKPGDYIALQAYVNPTEETFETLQSLRHGFRDRYRLATTVGFGPRFLHSTGQLHKGDAGHGLFIQFIGDDPQDISIPDEAGLPASSMTFGLLKAAQALGDRQALLSAGRRVLAIHLGNDVAGGLGILDEAFQS